MTFNAYSHQINDMQQQLKDNEQELKVLAVKNENAKVAEEMQGAKVRDIQSKIMETESDHAKLEAENQQLTNELNARVRHLTFYFFFSITLYADVDESLAHLSRRLVGELIVYPCSGIRPSSVRRPPVVHNFKHEYLCNQLADHNEILSEATLGWGKGCIRFWARSDTNSGFHGNK